MHIAIIGSHGIPASYGGFETFAEHLAVALADHGQRITVVNERDHVKSFSHKGVELLFSKYNKSTSPISYYRNSIDLTKNADVLIVCGSAGSINYGRIPHKTRIITNIDGLEHKRKRYSFLQRKIVYFLQRLAIRRSHSVVADSEHVLLYWKNILPEYSGKMSMIAYGADEFNPVNSDVLNKFNLKPNEYFLVIARLVPENNIEMILNAYKHYKSNKKLVIVGNTDSAYSKKLMSHADKRVIFTQAIYDKGILDSLRQNCYLYIHGHSVGGTNPSLLEAMAAKCACLCHDNVFNRETSGDAQDYFRESYELAIHLNSLEHNLLHVEAMKLKSSERIKQYSWNKLTGEYLSLIQNTLQSNKPV